MDVVLILFLGLISQLQASVTPKPNCPSVNICGEPLPKDSLCTLDESKNCIRFFKSRCHLYIAGCLMQTNFTDISKEYCGMEGWLCDEPPYEHWTLFFGHEDEPSDDVAIV